jgi:LysM repeat protein
MTATVAFAPRTEQRVAAAPRRPSAGAAPRRLPASVYRRRRLVVGVLLAAPVVLAGAVAAGELTGPGGDPASAAVTGAAADPVVVVARPGDSLWSIAERFHGDVPLDRYLDALIARNGGTAIQAGQAVALP